jgi:drug/metabolite transporter (DMT)-like permease
MLVIVALGLGAAAVYGASDFFGASAARRLNLISATTFNYAIAMVVILVGVLVVGGTWSDRAAWTGIIGGFFAVLGLLAFYGVLAIGPMSLLSPIIALIQSAVPVAVSAITGQALTLTAWLAIGLAVVAILLLSPPPKRGRDHISIRGAALAVFSGLTLGLTLVVLDQAPKDSGVVPAAWEIASGLVVLLAVLGFRAIRPRARWLAVFEAGSGGAGLSARRAWIESAGSGVLTAVADCFVIIGLHLGNLAVVSVLIALYPVVTVILAAAILKERIGRLQYVGIALVIVASLILTASGSQPTSG